MTPTIALAAFTLITVTNQGEVFHAKGFDTLRMCEQAKSVAVYGHTIEQHEEDMKRAAEREVKLDAEWRAAHPPRKASSEELRAGSSSLSSCASNGYNSRCWHMKDGMVYEDRPSLITWTVSNRTMPPEGIKHAECVIEPPKP